MKQRFFLRLMAWALRHLNAQVIGCSFMDSRPRVLVVILEHGPMVPSFIVGAMQTYCQVHGVPAANIVKPVQEDLKTDGVVH